MLQAWPSEIKIDTLNEPMEGWPFKEDGKPVAPLPPRPHGSEPKRRRLRKCSRDRLLTKLAGNGMSLPDVLMVLYSLTVSLEPKHDPLFAGPYVNPGPRRSDNAPAPGVAAFNMQDVADGITYDQFSDEDEASEGDSNGDDA